MPSMYQLQLQHYLKRGALVFGLLLVATILYFGLQSDGWKKLTSWASTASRTIGDTPEGEPANQKENELAGSTVQQLILQATQLVDDPELKPFERLERQADRIRVAEELMGRTDNTRAVGYGISTKLSALRMQEMIRFDNGLASSNTISQLESLARKNLSSFDEDTLRQSNLGNLCAKILSTLLESETNGFTIDEDALRAFEQVSKKYRHDIIVAEECYELLKRVHVHASEADRDKFLKIFRDEFGASRVERIKLIASDASHKLIDTEFELVRVFDVIQSQRTDTIKKLRDQILAAFDRGYISKYGYKRIFESIKDVARAMDYGMALELSEALENSIKGKAAMSKLAADALKIKKRMRLVGQTIALDGFETLAGEPLGNRNEKPRIYGVILFDENSLEDAKDFLLSIFRVAGRDAGRGKFGAAAIFVELGPIESSLSELEKISRLIGTIDVGISRKSSESGNQLMEQLEFDSKPLLLMLDDEDRVIGVDVLKEDFEQTYRDLKK